MSKGKHRRPQPGAARVRKIAVDGAAVATTTALAAAVVMTAVNEQSAGAASATASTTSTSQAHLAALVAQTEAKHHLSRAAIEKLRDEYLAHYGTRTATKTPTKSSSPTKSSKNHGFAAPRHHSTSTKTADHDRSPAPASTHLSTPAQVSSPKPSSTSPKLSSTSPSPSVSHVPVAATPSPTLVPAAVSAIGCVAHPSGCGYPDATNTGAHGSLTSHGSITSTTDGEVIANLDIQGFIKVTSANVTIENVRVTGGNIFGGIDLTKATGHTTITDVTVKSTASQLSGMTIRNATVTRANISGGQDGIDAWGSDGPNIVQDSYIHDLGRNTSVASHDDTLQTSGGNETFRHNTLLPFDGSDPMNSCLQIGALQGSLDQLTFADNLCDGGNYSLNANASGVPSPYAAGPLTFTGNRFGRDYRYGVKTNLAAPFRVTWSGNIDDRTGAPLN